MEEYWPGMIMSGVFSNRMIDVCNKLESFFMKLKTLDNLDLEGKKVLLRCDLNIPFDLQGKVLDKNNKIKRHKITIDELIYKGAKIVIISHLGNPKGNSNKPVFKKSFRNFC